MSKHRKVVCLLLAWLLGCAAAFAGAGSTASFESLLRNKKASSPRQAAPLSFEPNRGQAAPKVRFLSHRGGRAIFFTAREVSLVAVGDKHRPQAIHMRLKGANLARIEPLAPLPQTSNYLFGADASQWTTDVPHYAKVAYRAIYPGVDALFYGTDGELEHDFVVQPGADPGRIHFEFRGARRLRIDGGGDLLIETGWGTVRQRKPLIYQKSSDGDRRAIAGGFVLKGRREAGFEIGQYDHRESLVIDPVTVFSVGFGGGGVDDAFGVALDAAGNTYVTGITSSIDFPTNSPYQKSYGGGPFDVFVTKFGPDGSILYSTYIGGSDDDEGLGIKVDSQGNAYVTGFTKSSNFPTFGTFARGFGGLIDGFVLALDPSGSKLIYSTCLGGSAEDASQRIAIDPEGNAYVTGFTRSPNFPTMNPYQATLKGGFDAFVTRLSPIGQILYSTYLGGTQDDAANSLVIDETGQAFVTGFTQSKDFPATEGQYAGGLDVFVARLDPSGQLTAATFYGGTGDDTGNAIAIDPFGDVIVVGSTTSADLPITDMTQKYQPGAPNGFVAQFGPAPLPASATIAEATVRPGSEQRGITAAAFAPMSGVLTPHPDVSVAETRPRKFSYHLQTDLYFFTVESGFSPTCDGIVIRAVVTGKFKDDLGRALQALLTPPILCITAKEINDLDENRLLDKLTHTSGLSLTVAGAIDLLTPRMRESHANAPNQTHGFASLVDFSTEPMVSDNAVVNGASFQPRPVSPGEIITLFGANLGPQELASPSVNAFGLIDTSAGGTSVLFDGVPAPILYARADTVSVVVPYSAAGKSSTSMLVVSQKTPSMIVSVLQVAPAAPAIFTAAGGTGQAALQNSDGSYNSAANAAAIGSIVVLYATGEGQTNPAGVDGKLSTNPGPRPVLPVSVTIGGQPAEVVYFGGAPGLVAGLMQVNARVPKGIAAGPAVPIVLTVGNASSQPGITLAVR